MGIIGSLVGLGLIGTLGTILLKKADKADLAVLLDLALLAIALGMVYSKINDLYKAVTSMFGGFGG